MAWGDGSQASFTTTRVWTACISWLGGHRIRGVDSTVTDGGVVSATVTTVWHVATFPAPSPAENVTVVEPSGYAPDASAPPGVLSLLMETAPKQRSVAVAGGAQPEIAPRPGIPPVRSAGR